MAAKKAREEADVIKRAKEEAWRKQTEDAHKAGAYTRPLFGST